MPINIMPAGEQPAFRLDAEHRFQRAEQHAVLDEEQHPAIEPHVLRDEERNGEEQRHDRRPLAEDPGQPIGDGIADQRQDSDGQRRQSPSDQTKEM